MLTIVRDSSVANATRAFKVVLDGATVGKIKNGEVLELEVAPGPHTLVMKIDWCRSDIVEFDASDGDVRFRCGSLITGLTASIIKRDSYLYLRPESLLEA